MVITITGLGLIGGSLAIDLRKRGFASRIIGVDSCPENGEVALQTGLVDELTTLEEGVRRAGLIIVAVPADAAMELLPVILDISGERVVTDVCSTKGRIAESLKNHKNRKQYVASHPMAGTEFSGPLAAVTGLFDGKTAIICDRRLSGHHPLNLVRSMYSSLNMRIIDMDSANHDVHAAYVSHISHISSFVLALTVLEQEHNEKNIFDLAGGGFDSTVRLAKSSAEMWVPVFRQNRQNILTVLRTYIEKLHEFESSIASEEEDKLYTLIREANKIKKVLNR